MENYIPVLTRNKRPLAPCHPSRAKSLVAKGKAAFKYRYGIRCIVLHKSNIPKVKKSSMLTLQLNPGSRTTGLAVTRENPDGSRSCLLILEIHHRGRYITKKLSERRNKRRNRRGRKTRYRQPRFQHRKRPVGWLAPSIRSRYRNTLTWVARLARLLPISGIHLETCKFDPQLLSNPDIRDEEYQQGPLYRTNLKAAVLDRDGNKCAYCAKSGKNRKLEMEHIAPRSEGGTDRYDNRVASCQECNHKKSNTPLEVFLKRRTKKLAEIQAKTGMDLSDPTHMNIIIPQLLQDLRNLGWNIAEHSAATTAAGRILCHLPKSHANDAAVIGCPERLRYIPDQPISITATGRGGYQRCAPDKNGTPKGKPFRKYAKLPRELQRITPTPGHKKRQKRVDNVATGDFVSFIHQGVRVYGYGTINNESVAFPKPVWKSTKATGARVIERRHGYQVNYPATPES